MQNIMMTIWKDIKIVSDLIDTENLPCFNCKTDSSLFLSLSLLFLAHSSFISPPSLSLFIPFSHALFFSLSLFLFPLIYFLFHFPFSHCLLSFLSLFFTLPIYSFLSPHFPFSLSLPFFFSFLALSIFLILSISFLSLSISLLLSLFSVPFSLCVLFAKYSMESIKETYKHVVIFTVIRLIWYNAK